MLFNELDVKITASINAGLNSAQLLIAQNGNILKHSAYGKANLNTVFDIASLTKIFSITFLYQKYYLYNKLNLELTLQQIFPDFFANNSLNEKKDITIRMLLAHEAGFEPNPLFYDESYNSQLFCQDRDNFLDKLLKAPLVNSPNTCSLYSDVDFMLLTFILEALYQLPIDVLMHNQLCFLKDSRITYQPLKNGYSLAEIAPTELNGNTRDHFINFKNIRKKPIHGQVQDEKAYHCMSEISGHAGLFANAESLFYALNNITIPPEFLKSQSHDESFGLGWRLNKGDDITYHFGNYASNEAYGHTGWTGCAFIVDPIYNLTIIYLTNRKHSKVLAPYLDQNRFLGDVLWAGQYKNIMNEIYKTLGINQ